MNGQELARFLRALAKSVERMPLGEIERLPELLEKLVIEEPAKEKRRSQGPPKSEKFGQAPLLQILTELRQAPSRESGSDILERNDLTRAELTSLARLAQINITKKDDIPRIREKVIESIIGSRLNSLAIRGED
jgi:hypothetical protein